MDTIEQYGPHKNDGEKNNRIGPAPEKILPIAWSQQHPQKRGRQQHAGAKSRHKIGEHAIIIALVIFAHRVSDTLF